MSVTLVHLSDIHFGQEKGAVVIIHNDIKEQLINDAAQQCEGRAQGVIVTGDIAFAGKPEQYKDAAKWLDDLSAAIGCPKTDVQVVPGNHDIDRDAISSGCKLMLHEIIEHGEGRLDAFLESDLDREVLYGRFVAYRPFAEGYNCPLDLKGGRASDRTFKLAPGRSLRFIGLNSALICSARDEAGRLLLGARQHVLPRNPGEELVILIHHPLHWLRDSDDARRYVRSRARIFMSGHEHASALRVEKIEDGCDLAIIEAGATVPPRNSKDLYVYTYNILTFDWDQKSDGLIIKRVQRTWSEDNTRFGPGATETIVLGCPNFRSGPPAAKTIMLAVDDSNSQTMGGKIGGGKGEAAMADGLPLVLLRFFRDLTPAQRIAVLIELKQLPEGWRNPLTHNVERQFIESVARAGRLDEIRASIDRLT